MTADFEVLPSVFIVKSDVRESTYGYKTNGGGILVLTWKNGERTVYETPTEQDAKKAHLRLEAA